MNAIDSDAHALENEATWEYLAEGDQAFRPTMLISTSSGNSKAYVLTDEIMLTRAEDGMVDFFAGLGIGEGVSAPNEARSLRDVEARVRHMDELGTDVQVIYP